MAFKELSDNQKDTLDTLKSAATTRRRAELSKILAEERLYFIELTRDLFSGDPWFLDQSAGVQAALRASHADDEGFERRRMADAMFWLAETQTLIDEAKRTLSDDSDG